MTDLQAALGKRFGEQRVSILPTKESEISLIVLDLELNSPVTLIMTNGLSDYRMPVHEKMKGREFNELYFCLPSYWKWEELDNDQMNWIFPWIQKLSKYVIEKNAWFGHGHTMPCGTDEKRLSTTMRQNYFFLSDPVLLKNELEPIQLGEKSVQFLSVIPIFPDEMDYKQGKGTFKFEQKLRTHGITEKLDDFRGTILRSKWRFLKR